MGHRPQDVATDGLPVGLQLDGVFLLVEAGVELIEGLGVLFPLDGLNGLELDPGGEGAHHRGDGHHTYHGHRVTRVAQGKDPVGEHKVVVDAESAHQGGGDAVCVAVRQGGDAHHRQHKDQSGVVFRAGMAQ